MSDHATLPPSSAKEWSNCSGWLVLNEATPEPPETDAARWGTECHGIAEIMLAALRTGTRPPPPGDMDAEMYECAELYANHCAELMHKCHVYGGDALGIETRLHTDINPSVWGTCDFYLWDAKSRTLYIRDFKAGHLIVEPDDPQILIYMWGVMKKLGIDDQYCRVDIGVVQPRGYHREGPIRTVSGPAVDYRPQYSKLIVAAEANLARDKPVQAGPHCYQCNARTRCPAANETGQSLPYAVAEAIPAELSPAEAGLLLRNTRRAIKYLEQMEKAYSGEVEGHLRAGKQVPGWGMETSYARSKEWTVPDEEVLLLGQMFGADLSKPGLITPTQAEKKGIDKEILNGYCTRRTTGVKLTESDDTTIANIFNGVK